MFSLLLRLSASRVLAERAIMIMRLTLMNSVSQVTAQSGMIRATLTWVRCPLSVATPMWSWRMLNVTESRKICRTVEDPNDKNTIYTCTYDAQCYMLDLVNVKYNHKTNV